MGRKKRKEKKRVEKINRRQTTGLGTVVREQHLSKIELASSERGWIACAIGQCTRIEGGTKLVGLLRSGAGKSRNCSLMSCLQSIFICIERFSWKRFIKLLGPTFFGQLLISSDALKSLRLWSNYSMSDIHKRCCYRVRCLVYSFIDGLLLRRRRPSWNHWSRLEQSIEQMIYFLYSSVH